MAGYLEKTFTIQPGVTSLPIQFDYNFVTEEYPEWVNTVYDDKLRVTVMAPDGSVHELAVETVNSSQFQSIGGIDFPGGDSTVGHTGWKTITVTIPVTQGPGNYKIEVSDAGDEVFDSAVLIDNIRLKHDTP
ncbi:conserved hypothetical protein [Beggiatoa sp. PS]|nr:conserved hypothetical protein [Beggiatoa sp. PS]